MSCRVLVWFVSIGGWNGRNLKVWGFPRAVAHTVSEELMFPTAEFIPFYVCLRTQMAALPSVPVRRLTLLTMLTLVLDDGIN